jgi:hypothetical protein
MEGNALSSFCERCGDWAPIGAGSVHSCLHCDRYVCTECWDARRRRCADCAPLIARASRARDLTLLRRVDRRLREVARDASALTAQTSEADGSTIDAELACLRLKTSNAVENGEDALVRRLRSARAGEVESLAGRIRRHAAIADAAVARADRVAWRLRGAPSGEVESLARRMRRQSAVADAAVAGADLAAWAPPVRDDAPAPPTPRRQLLVGGLVGGAVALVAVVVLAGDLAPGPSGREGVLGGAPADAGSSPTGSDGGKVAASPAAETHRVSVAFDFNEVRMGEGIGDAWGRVPTTAAAESIQVAAYPTPFDRSARLTSTGQPNIAACTAVVPQDLQRIAFDVYIDPARPAVGTLSLYAGGKHAALEIVIDADGPLSARVATGELTPGPRIAAGAWSSVELIAEGGDLRWRVRSVAEPTAAAAGGPLGLAALDPITRICLGVVGPAGRAVSYDNLEIHGTNTGG